MKRGGEWGEERRGVGLREEGSGVARGGEWGGERRGVGWREEGSGVGRGGEWGGERREGSTGLCLCLLCLFSLGDGYVCAQRLP